MTKKKNTEFVNLVKSYPRMDVEDLRLALSSQLDLFTNLWVFGMGLVVAMIGLALQLPSEGYSLVAKSGMAFTAAILYVVLLGRGRDPEKRLEDILKETDYFDAKEIIQKRERA